MFTAARRRIDTAAGRFIHRRSPARPAPISVSRRRLYILPTRGGCLFGGLLLVMLLGATNYGNSMAFALTFWLAGVALVSMHHAHRNLVGIEIYRVQASPVFTGQALDFQIVLQSQARRPRRAVQLRAADQRGGQSATLERDRQHILTVAVATHRRGRMSCPRLRIETLYPLGLFKAWSWIHPQAEALVYPRREGRTALPDASGGVRHPGHTSGRGNEEFTGHRRYMHGDTPRHIDWKASARSDDLLVNEYAGRRAGTLWLDYRQLADNHEARLSQLALWVTEAEAAQRHYGLCLPHSLIQPGRGRAHRQACLRALALA